jgi:DNA-binding MarR family transcriptional regulator
MVRVAVSASVAISPFYVGRGLEHLLDLHPLAHQRSATENAYTRHFKKCLDRIRASSLLKGTKSLAIELILQAWDAFENRTVKADLGIIIRTTLTDLASCTGCSVKTVSEALKTLDERGFIPRLKIQNGSGGGVFIEICDVKAMISELEQLLDAENM